MSDSFAARNDGQAGRTRWNRSPCADYRTINTRRETVDKARPTGGHSAGAAACNPERPHRLAAREEERQKCRDGGDAQLARRFLMASRIGAGEPVPHAESAISLPRLPWPPTCADRLPRWHINNTRRLPGTFCSRHRSASRSRMRGLVADLLLEARR